MHEDREGRQRLTLMEVLDMALGRIRGYEHERSVDEMSNQSREEQLIEAVQKTCKEAYEDGAVPTHAGMHPDDIRALNMDVSTVVYGWDFVVRFPVGKCEKVADGGTRYTSLVKSVLVVPDERLERNTANVVNAEGAFVAGYTETP